MPGIVTWNKTLLRPRPSDIGVIWSGWFSLRSGIIVLREACSVQILVKFKSNCWTNQLKERVLSCVRHIEESVGLDKQGLIHGFIC